MMSLRRTHMHTFFDEPFQRETCGSVRFYLLVNEKVYDDDNKKVAFALS